jgi:hypothetical protein
MAPPHRNYVYAKLLLHGAAPTWADFMRDFGLTKDEALHALETLAASHDVVGLTTQQGVATYILMAHPFSNLPTNHVATLDRSACIAALGALGCNDASALGGSVRRYGN